MLYLYAITEPAGGVPDVPGLEGRPLLAVAEGVLAAVCSAHERPPGRATAEEVRAHAAVVESLAEVGPVLPARFGTGFGDEAALRRELAAREPELRAALDRVRGRVELGVRVASTEEQPRPEPPADGRAYLLRRLEQQQRASALADEVHHALAQFAAATTVRVTAGQPLLLSAAYLVGRDDVDAFRARVEALAREHPRLDVLCTGPWPPYSFAAPDGDAP